MFSVVVATPDVVGARMAGPGIRAWHFAQELAKHVPTTLIAKVGGPNVLQQGSKEAQNALRNANVIIGQPARGFRPRKNQRVIYDLFDPLVLELRELYGSKPSPRQRLHMAAEWMRLLYALRHADLLIAATPQQKHFYTQLQSSDAPWIEVPFGVEIDNACAKPKDNLVIWGGGVWEWLDPQTAIDAIVQLNQQGLRCNLLFLGRARPNPHAIDRRREDRFDRLLERGAPYVSSNGEWVPYAERLSWLRSGKIAMMLHRSTAEAACSIRTRLFDAIAAGVPVVATEQGFAAELVGRERLGVVVPPSDVGAVAAAVRRLLTDDAFHAECVQNLERIRPRFAWDVVTRPLVDAVIEWQKQER